MVAEGNDKLMEEFFDKGTIPVEDLVPGLKAAIAFAGPDAVDELARIPLEAGFGTGLFGVLAASIALLGVGAGSTLAAGASAVPHNSPVR